MVGITNLSAQTFLAGNLTNRDSALAWFDEILGVDQSGLVGGTIHESQSTSPTSDPFFESRFWAKSTIKYRGQAYQDVYLLYDIENQMVTLDRPGGFTSISLLLSNDNIEWFEMHGHKFVNLKNRDGFYDWMVMGEQLDLFVRRSKVETVNTNDLIVEYQELTKIFVRKDDQIYPVRSKKDIIKLYPEDKQMIKKYIRSNGLKINIRNESDIVLLTRYCDQL
ncbi:MAG: hypothetical protein JXQ90_04205 [Cyclobacteriaceae bacterium]